MLVPLVPTSLDDFAGMKLVFLNARVGQQTDVVVDIKVEQRAGLPASLIDNKVVESVVL